VRVEQKARASVNPLRCCAVTNMRRRTRNATGDARNTHPTPRFSSRGKDLHASQLNEMEAASLNVLIVSSGIGPIRETLPRTRSLTFRRRARAAPSHEAPERFFTEQRERN
jgi:hypothetical protein